jgi:hypothetical protein
MLFGAQKKKKKKNKKVSTDCKIPSFGSGILPLDKLLQLLLLLLLPLLLFLPLLLPSAIGWFILIRILLFNLIWIWIRLFDPDPDPY